MADSIKVICRFRPQNSREKAQNAYIVVKVSDDHTLCEVTHPDTTKQPKPLAFNFDCVFDWTSTQTEVYEHAASHLVEQIFEGFNATIFAYGQTGAGKTFSMEGKLGSPHRGIVPRTVEHIFETIAEAEENMEYLLQISYVEIYLEALRDLFKPSNNNLKIRDSNTGVYIENVTEMYVRDAQEVIDLMELGSKARTVAGTAMNAVSSRSHGVFMLKLTQTNTQHGTKKLSKLMMIDLAGSEKVSKTGAQGQTLKEAQKINQSLSALGNVMSQLSAGKPHISYRDSVLTRLLSDSLGGNCKTTLLVACSPSSFNADETITTCRFGVRAKKIKNKAKINAEKTVAEYKVEVAALNEKILALQTLVKALQLDLKRAKKGEMKESDQGQADRIIGMMDMQDLMSDGKDKKKKKKKKKKGFFRAGFEPPKFDEPAADKKEKKKDDAGAGGGDADETKDDDDDEQDDNKYDEDDDDSTMDVAKLKDAEDRANKAEEHIKYLEAELIKAQAAAATNSGLADVEPPPSPRKRSSVLPAPQRPRASLATIKTTQLVNRSRTNSSNQGTPTGSNVLALPSGAVSTRKSGMSFGFEDIPEDGPKFHTGQQSMSIRKDQDFQTEQGDMYGQENVEVVVTEIQMPSHLADLDPALLEQARRGLQQENYDLRQQMEQLVHELEQSRIRLEKKNEKIKLEKNKTEDAEMECDRLLLQQQVLEERIESFEQDRKREQKQLDSFKEENFLIKQEIAALKGKLAAKHKEMQDQIVEIRQREAKRADEFMQQAIKQFKRLQKQQQVQQIQQQQQQNQQQLQQQKQMSSVSQQNEMRTRMQRAGSSAYQIMTMEEQQAELQRQRQVMAQQMQHLKQATFEQLERIQLEQMKIKSALQSKVEECVALNMALSEKEDEIKELHHKIREKDNSLHIQASQLKAFGDLKIKSDQIHQQEFKRAQDTIYALKKQLQKIQRMNTQEQMKDHGGSALLQHQRSHIPTPLRGGGGKKKNKTTETNGAQKPMMNGHGGNMPMPMRGGGGGGGPSHKPGASITSQFFNQNLRSTPSTPSLLPKYAGGGGASTASFSSLAANGSHSRNASSRHAANGYAQANGLSRQRSANKGGYW